MTRPAVSISPLVLLALLLAGPSAALAQRQLNDIPDPDPEIERAALQVADGFEVNLFAADPALAKPTQIAFDALGRLWVASSETYPQVKPGQQPDDKILILDDSDGDGRADKTTVFARGLLIPTGVEPADGGAYVANSSELVFLSDTDGDGQADSRRVVLSGFGTEDTHHLLHTLRRGPDGRLYANQSVYIHSSIETPLGVRRLSGGGIWRFWPAGCELEVFAARTLQPLGPLLRPLGPIVRHRRRRARRNRLCLSRRGIGRGGGRGANSRLPEPGQPQGVCGLAIVESRHMPDDWQGSLIDERFSRPSRLPLCAQRGRRRFCLARAGRADQVDARRPFARSTSPRAPTERFTSPIGTTRSSSTARSIFAIRAATTPTAASGASRPRGVRWLPARSFPRPRRASYCRALESPESWTRHFARRLLAERGREVAQDLSRLDRRPRRPPARLGTSSARRAVGVSRARRRRARAALPVAESQGSACPGGGGSRAGPVARQLPDALGSLRPLVADESPRVRLEAVCASTRIGTPEAVQIAMRALDGPRDRFLDHALYLAAANTQAAWLPALERAQIDFDGDPRHLAFALIAADATPAVAPLAALVRSGKLPADDRAGALAMLVKLGGPAELAMVFDRALDSAVAAGAARRIALGPGQGGGRIANCDLKAIWIDWPRCFRPTTRACGRPRPMRPAPGSSNRCGRNSSSWGPPPPRPRRFAVPRWKDWPRWVERPAARP